MTHIPQPRRLGTVSLPSLQQGRQVTYVEDGYQHHPPRIDRRRERTSIENDDEDEADVAEDTRFERTKNRASDDLTTFPLTRDYIGSSR